MLEKATARYASAGTKRSAAVSMCRVAKMVVTADAGVLSGQLKRWFAEGRGGRLVSDMMEVLACMDAEGLEEMLSARTEAEGTFVEQAMELLGLTRDSEMFAGLEETIELLTSKSSSSEEDFDEDESMREETPTTPQPGDSMCVLFMDE